MMPKGTSLALVVVIAVAGAAQSAKSEPKSQPTAAPRAPATPTPPPSGSPASHTSVTETSPLWAYRNLVKVEAVPPSGASLGRGWNSFLRQQTSSNCVEFEEIQVPLWINTIK